MVIILTQDESIVDGNGRKTLTPVYATFGNVRALHSLTVNFFVFVLGVFEGTPTKTQWVSGHSNS